MFKFFQHSLIYIHLYIIYIYISSTTQWYFNENVFDVFMCGCFLNMNIITAEIFVIAALFVDK